MAFGSGLISKLPGSGTLQLFSRAFVFFNGQLLTQESSVTVTKQSNSNPISTLHSGFAGFSRGAGTVRISIDNAVPSADFEVYPDFFLKTGEPVDIGIVMGARTTYIRAFIEETSYTHSVNDASKMSIQLIGRLEVFE